MKGAKSSPIRIELLLLMFGALLFSCSPKAAKGLQKAEIPEPLPEFSDVQADERVYAVDQFIELRIKKTACYGKCPVFEATVYANGKVKYHGKNNVEKSGHWEANLNDIQLRQLVESAESADYFKLSPVYPDSGQEIVDFPNTITYLKIGLSEHQIRNNHEAPVQLLDFENFLLDLLDQMDWKKVSD